MKISDEKINANTLNAKLGGVKTVEGKEISKMNALSHGILANTKCEFDELDIDSIFKKICIEFNVKTIHQSFLAEELVSTYVKLSRCAKFQKQKINESLNSFDSLGDLSLIRIKEGYKSQVDEKLMQSIELVITRYEPQLVNRMLRLISELKLLQLESSNLGSFGNKEEEE